MRGKRKTYRSIHNKKKGEIKRGSKVNQTDEGLLRKGDSDQAINRSDGEVKNEVNME